MCTTLFRRSISVCVEHLFVNLWAMLEFMKCSLAKTKKKNENHKIGGSQLRGRPKWKRTKISKTREKFRSQANENETTSALHVSVLMVSFFLSASLFILSMFFSRFVALLLFVSSPPSFDTTSTKQNDDRVVSKSSETKLRSAIERAFCEELNGWKSASSTWTEHLQMVSYRMSTSI